MKSQNTKLPNDTSAFENSSTTTEREIQFHLAIKRKEAKKIITKRLFFNSRDPVYGKFNKKLDPIWLLSLSSFHLQLMKNKE